MPRTRPLALFVLLLTILTQLLGPVFAHAQSDVPVVMLSDIHFDPFHDPAKVPQLRREPIEHWPAILNSPTSATQAADLDALQTACHARALDTAWPLLKTTVAAARDAETRPVFITLSGDLLTHEFPCRFTHLLPTTKPEDVSAFAAKTVAFVLLELRQAFPHSPVYAALGNNDSGCADYRGTPADPFLTSASQALAAAAHVAAASFTPEGDYSVPLPAPMDHARLIVLEDTFASRQFNTCAAAADRAPEKAQIDWLRAQLATARTRHEHVWVMAHIPPGIDVYASFRRYLLQPAQLCSAQPQPFLADPTLSDALLDSADIVRLALFGHTHMDEFRLLHRDSAAEGLSSRPEPPFSTPSSRPKRSEAERPAVHSASAEGTSLSQQLAIPAKLVPSVSPYVGNHPAFLVATLNPHTAILKDWRTYVSPGPDGSTPPWTVAYRFTSAYHLPDLSAASATELADAFTTDKTGGTVESTAFRQHFYPGDIGLYALGLAQIWPAYACAVREDRPSAVHTCICATMSPPAAQPPQP